LFSSYDNSSAVVTNMSKMQFINETVKMMLRCKTTIEMVLLENILLTNAGWIRCEK
jgi:hypothetical protein